MNKAILIGRLTRDPELRYTSSNRAVCQFTVAIDRPFTNQSTGQREADFINCVVWGKQAENLAKYCTKGSLIGVSGRIQTRNYDGQDGRKVYVTEVVASNITFLGSKNNSTNSSEPSFEDIPTSNTNNESFDTTDLTEDPFKDYGSEVVLNDEDLPF